MKVITLLQLEGAPRKGTVTPLVAPLVGLGVAAPSAVRTDAVGTRLWNLESLDATYNIVK